jgi:Flp pilus assembly protein TadB
MRGRGSRWAMGLLIAVSVIVAMPSDASVRAASSVADMQVMIVVDRSGSMSGGALTAATSAVVGFVDSLPVGIAVGLVSFGSTVSVDVAATTDRAAVRDGITRLTAGGRTALYDAVAVAVDAFQGPLEHRLVVVLSDGGDNASITSLDDVVALTRTIDVEVIELVTSESDRAALDRLARPGPVRSVDSAAELAAAYAELAESLVDRAVTERLPVDRPLTDRLDVGQSSTADGSVVVPASGGSLDVAIGSALVVGGAGVVVSAAGRARRARRRRARLPVAPRPQATRTANEGPVRRRTASMLLAAGSSMGVEPFLVTLAATTVGVAVVFWFVSPPLIVLGLTVPVVARSRLQRRATARRDAFVEQLPDTLLLLASMMRSGYGLVQAIDAVAREADDPTDVWFERVLLEVRAGRDLGDALRALSADVRSTDLDWVVVAVSINAEVGGEMSGTLDNVAAMMRERAQLRGKVQALTAEGRMSARLMLALPPLTVLATIVLNPDYGRILLEPAGLVMLAAAASLMMIGHLWIGRLIGRVAR